ncbi:MAG: DUF4097 family beta strand repeat-containing protein [Acidobacteria bacterium]|nr:DUF4097 family beta strand repeat-containing protein [Acidobacteriota bacterium]
MKLRILFALLLVAGAWVAGRALTDRGGDEGVVGSALADVKAGERVINDSYKLSAGARVEIAGIHGNVNVATVDGDTAEVRIVTEASDARDLEKHKITVEGSGDRLVVRGADNNRGGFWRWVAGRRGRVSHRVELRVPRRVELRATGVHGDLTVGALEGALKLSGVHGDVEVARAAGQANLSGIHGNVTVGLASLSGEGVRVSGVHGQIEFRLAADVNADVSVHGIHGSVNVENPSVTVEEDERHRFEGRVGAGGTPIRVSGVHGDVALTRG